MKSIQLSLLTSGTIIIMERGYTMNSGKMNILLSVLLSAIFFAACSKHAVPLIEYDNIAIMSKSGKALSSEDVKKALTIAAAEAKRNWQITDVAPGHAKASLVVRGKHTIIIDITYSESKLDVKYSDSTNMKYSVDDKGNKEIHPGYNTWVGEFVKAIEKILLSM